MGIGYCALDWVLRPLQAMDPKDHIVTGTAGSDVGEANIYFGTLSGTGQTNSGAKMTQSGLL
jgi:hypothetical protein